MQCIGRRFSVLHHGDTDIVGARIGAIGLFAREIFSRHDAHAGFRPQPLRDRFATAMLRHVEPEEEAAGRTLVAVTISDDLVGEIELGVVELAILLDVSFVGYDAIARVGVVVLSNAAPRADVSADRAIRRRTPMAARAR